jgi:hypothetical protein
MACAVFFMDLVGIHLTWQLGCALFLLLTSHSIVCHRRCIVYNSCGRRPAVDVLMDDGHVVLGHDW